MKIAVLGTGNVGRALAARLAGLGHDVVIGTRDVQATLSRSGPGPMGTAPYAQWQHEHPDVQLVALPDAGEHGEIVLNAINGQNALTALEAVGPERLAGKVLLDLALPLDLSKGLPPTLTIVNTDSLGEQVQRLAPDARVVKSLNTVYFEVMIDPARVPGEHNLFIAGNDPEAKAVVAHLLGEFGWPDGSVIDLGDITAARGAEMYSRLFFELHNIFGSFDFNISVHRAN